MQDCIGNPLDTKDVVLAHDGARGLRMATVHLYHPRGQVYVRFMDDLKIRKVSQIDTYLIRQATAEKHDARLYG